MLPSKTIPEVNRKGHTCTLKAKVKASPKNKAANAIEVEETEDNDTPGNTARNASFNVSIISISPESFHPKKVCSLLCCVRFHFNYGFTEGQEYEKESYLFVLRDRHKQLRWHTGR